MKKVQQPIVPLCVRQGDVLIVEAAYRGGKSAEGKPVLGRGDIVLMHGEVTGHAHRIAKPKGKAILLDVQAERYLQILAEVTITHEEHSPIVLREGRYQQAFQVEDFGQEVRRVVD